MTGYTVHTGTSLKFSSGWDRIFEGEKPKTSKIESRPAKKGLSAKTVKKLATKKPAVKASKIPAKSSQTLAAKPAKKKAAAKAVKKGK